MHLGFPTSADSWGELLDSLYNQIARKSLTREGGYQHGSFKNDVNPRQASFIYEVNFMHITFQRIGAAAIVATGLSACSNLSLPPTSTSTSTLRQPTMIGALSLGAFQQHGDSACEIKGFWHFSGSCALESVSSGGGNIKFKKYKGITLTIGVGAFNANQPSDFIVGVGTSSKDITGTFKGKKFLNYTDLSHALRLQQGKGRRVLGRHSYTQFFSTLQTRRSH